MSGWAVWLAPALAIGASLVLTPLIRQYLLAHDVVDLPDSRRSHSRPTPRGGGLAMAAGLCLAALILATQFPQAAPLPVLVVILAGLGWLDDRHNLKVGWRLTSQLGIAFLVVLWTGVPASIAFGPVSIEQELLWMALAVVAVVWLINLHNFMDGSDGLAAGQGIWSGLAFGLAFAMSEAWFEAFMAFSLAGTCLGFLHWNRPPARIFMGDCGSVLLGGTVAWLALTGAESGVISIWISLIISSVFVIDATATLLRRVLSGQQWYTPHRSHAYQRLIISGWTHGQVLALYGLINGLIVLPIYLIGLFHPELDFWLAIMVAGLLVSGWWYLQSGNNGDEEQQA